MPRILIADDDPATRTLLSGVLDDEGYTVATASDGDSALAMVAAASPDLLITDLMMPGLTGWSVFARVRRLAPRLPIIVMSGAESGVRQQDAALAPAAVFLRKPFDLDQLLALVANLIGPSQADRTA